MQFFGNFWRTICHLIGVCPFLKRIPDPPLCRACVWNSPWATCFVPRLKLHQKLGLHCYFLFRWRRMSRLKYACDLDKSVLINNFEKRGWIPVSPDEDWNFYWYVLKEYRNSEKFRFGSILENTSFKFTEQNWGMPNFSVFVSLKTPCRSSYWN